MAKDFFQDILPPQGASGKPSRPTPPPPPPREEEPEQEDRLSMDEPPAEPFREQRSIRNIPVSSRGTRRPVSLERDRDMGGSGTPPPSARKRGSRLWMWAIVALLILVLGLIFLVALRPSSITVVPRSQVVVFDSSMQFSAYPQGTATGTLPYTVETVQVEDSKIVAAQGSEDAKIKATGTIVITNNYSTDPVRLIATTRFETPEGLIYRITEDIAVPGKKGTVPGELSATVEAAEPGEKYNIGPVAKFTLPGLKDNAAMYRDVHARSATGVTGGFVGKRPVVPAGEIEAARAEIRSRLEQKIRDAVASKTNTDTVALPDLVRVTYTSLPTGEEGSGSARVRESARADVPVFSASAFAQTVARGVSADAEQSSTFVKNPGALKATLMTGVEAPVLGSSPIVFTLSGTGQLIWNVDPIALAEALAGREESAFEAIVGSFPGIDEARARIQPFWKNTFPEDPRTIQVRLEEPKALDAS